MTCGRAREIDVEAFLIDSGASEFDSFRTHYPSCAECADEVASWTAFDLALRDVLDSDDIGPATHPEPDRLETYLASPETMGAEAAEIENHLASCPTCQTEVSVLRRFDPGLLIASTESTETRLDRADSPVRGSLRDALYDFFESISFGLGGRAVIPAFAVASLATLGVLWWNGVFGAATGTPDPSVGPPRLAQEAAQQPQIHDSPDSPSPIVIADGNAPAANPDRVELAESESLAPSPDIQPESLVETEKEFDQHELREEILLAALTTLPLPSYSMPSDAESQSWMRPFGAIRSGPASVTVETRAPSDYAGLTLSASPRLWWSVSADTQFPIQVTLVDDDEIEPLLRLEFREPHAAGLYSIDLAQHEIELEAGADYRWFVSLLVDPEDPARNPVSVGALRVIPESDPRRETAAQSPGSERGHTLARLGLWYDAFDFFATLSLAHPEIEQLARYREQLVKLAKDQR